MCILYKLQVTTVNFGTTIHNDEFDMGKQDGYSEN